MIKACFCAIAMMIGAAIGATAPASWGDASRGLTSSTAGQPMTLAMVYRPFQHD